MHVTKILRIVCILFSGGVYLLLVRINLYSAGFLTLIEYLFAIPFILIAIFTFVIDSSDFRKTKRRIEYLPTTFALVFIFIISAMKIYISIKDNSPALFTIRSNEFQSSSANYTVEFKKSGEFKLSEIYADMATNYFGEYTINDSIINLDYSDMSEKIISHQLLVRKEMSREFPDSLITNYYQLNDQTKSIDTTVMSFHLVN